MEYLWDILSFASKGFVVFLTVAACALVVALLVRRERDESGHLKVRPLNKTMKALRESLQAVIMEPKDYKKHSKALAKQEKRRERPTRNIFVLTFKGDVSASGVACLREEISALLAVTQSEDEVVVKLESPGGMVHGYGLAASQLKRLVDHGVRLTVCVDKVAASGGYLMACVADEVIAAPFSIIGSIGVAAPVPNVHRLLKSRGVDYEDYTAGEYKRTVTLFGEITKKGRQKFQEQLEETHKIFKEFIQTHKPDLDLANVATGEHWLAVRAKELGLVHRIMTSDDYLLEQLDSANLYEVHYERPKNLRERLGAGIVEVTEKLVLRLWGALGFSAGI